MDFSSFSNAHKRPTLKTETLLIKSPLQCLQMRKLFDSAALLSIRLPKLSHHDNKGRAENRSDKRLRIFFNRTFKKLRNAVKLIVVRLRHNPICLQAWDGVVVQNDWSVAALWATHQCPFKMSLWFLSNRSLLLPSERHGNRLFLPGDL